MNQRNRILTTLTFCVFLLANSFLVKGQTKEKFNLLVEKYVRLALTIGQYDKDFVDAYFGPESLKPTKGKSAIFPKDSLLIEVRNLQSEISNISNSTKWNATIRKRANWINYQLIACSRQIRVIGGEERDFELESKEFYGLSAPAYKEEHFRKIVAQIETLLPGNGLLTDRIQNLYRQFTIPKEKVDTLMKVAVREARMRTLKYVDLPDKAVTKIELVTSKEINAPAFNRYLGNYTGIIQINMDSPIRLTNIFDWAAHEGYPGHQLYNTLLEKCLYREKGWLENSIFLLRSPGRVIMEGSADYGVDLIFPDKQRNLFAKEVLLPLAGIDTTNTDLYFEIIQLRRQLTYSRNEIAKGVMAGTMADTTALRWMTQYGFIDPSRASTLIKATVSFASSNICYTYGEDVIRTLVATRAGKSNDPKKLWESFIWLLSNQITTEELLR